MADLIDLQPRGKDTERAEAILRELAALMEAREMCLVHKPDCIVLAVFDPTRTSGHEWRAVAQIASILPTQVCWRPVEWSAADLAKHQWRIT